MAVSIADKIRFLRNYVTGFEAKNGVKVRKNKVYLNPSINQSDFLDEVDAYYRDIRSTLSVPVKIVRARNQELKQFYNDLENIQISNDRMKVYFVKAENEHSKVTKVKNGYYVNEGMFRKYYFNFDIIRAGGDGGEQYIEQLTKSIPKHYSKMYKFLMSMSGAEFNGTFPNVELFVDDIKILNNRYKPVYFENRIIDTKNVRDKTYQSINKFVVYAWDSEFVDDEEMDEHISEFMDRTQRGFR